MLAHGVIAVLPFRSFSAFCRSLCVLMSPMRHCDQLVLAAQLSGLSYCCCTMFIRMYTQAYHNWIMKDLSLSESSYPMNLAETASIFFEVIH
jgi:hypothetical protein